MTISPDHSDPDSLDHGSRFVESVILGEMADAAFREECHRRGLRLADALRAPLDWLTSRGGTDAVH